ncbi:L,D-transpeptidase family protein [Lachnospiraceae bacterium 62-35]
MRRFFRQSAAVLLTASMLLAGSFTAFADGPGDVLGDNTAAQTEGTNDQQAGGSEQSSGEQQTGESQTSQEQQTGEDQASQGQQADEGQISQEQQAGEDQTSQEQQTGEGEASGGQEQISQEIIQANTPRIQSQAMTHENTWTNPVAGSGEITAGEAGFRSLCVYLSNIVGDIYYRTFTSSIGWSPWVMNGEHTTEYPIGTSVEAVQFKLVGFAGNKFSIHYSTVLSDGTELDWASDGETAGTMGIGKHIKSLRISLWGREGEPWPNPSEHPLDAAAYDGVVLGDGPATYSNGNTAPFTGWGWKYRDRYYFVNNQAVTGWQYIDGYKYYFDETGKLVTDLEPIIGNQGPFLIKINKQRCTTTIYASDGANGFIIPVKSFLCSPGDDTPIGTFKTPQKIRWHTMIHNVYCQYLTRITKGFLMHSLIYDKPDPYTMWPDTYNYLGVARSAGCVRFKTADAKWIYDNCPLGTTVEIYNSPIPGPYDRPAIEWIIPMTQTYDPTDPNLPENNPQQ